MSRPIAESVSLLSETLTNCKTNLKDKGVESDTIKISDVDEKIAEIQAGGGSSGESTDLLHNDYFSIPENEEGLNVFYLFEGTGLEDTFELIIDKEKLAEDGLDKGSLFLFYKGIEIANCSIESVKTSPLIQLSSLSTNTINFTIKGTDSFPFMLFALVVDYTGFSMDTSKNIKTMLLVRMSVTG